MIQQQEDFNIDNPKHVLEHLETYRGSKLYEFGQLYIVVEKGAKDITPLDVVRAFKVIQTTLDNPNTANTLIKDITFTKNNRYGHTYTWNTQSYKGNTEIPRMV